MIEMLFLLIVGHFVCDYVFQTDAIATGKNRNIEAAKFGVDWYYWMTAHAATHSVPVYLITGRIELAAFELATHFVIDFGKCEKRYNLHLDQVFHIGVKVMITAIYFLATSV